MKKLPSNPLPLQMYRAGPKKTILSGGDADDRHDNACNNVREQLKWMAIEDPWRDPATLPPRSLVYQQHIALVEVERKRFIDCFEIQSDRALISPDGEFAILGTRLRWEGWLAATLGFKAADYRVQLCSAHKHEMPCSDCQEDYEQMRRDDARNYDNRG